MKIIDHSERDHALLSASSSSMWLNCPPSARDNDKMPDTSSKYAEKGTKAHEYGETELRHHFDIISKEERDRIVAEIKTSDYHDKEMDNCIEEYFDFATDLYAEKGPTTHVSIEERLDYSMYAPKGFGTGDLIMVSYGVLDIIDYKHGKGVKVSAENNSQMKLYALGAYHAYNFLYDIETIRMTIFQPRINNISTFEMDVKELLDWGESYVKPRAKLAFDGEGEYSPGDHCRWCKMKATCRARAEKNLELAQEMFKNPEPNTLSNDEISYLLGATEDLVKWVKDLKSHALDEAVNGVHYTGWKLVEGRSNRKYADEEKVKSTLLENGYTLADILKEPQVKGITDMTKTLGKKKFNELLSEVVIKPPGKPKLAKDKDERPELGTVESVKKYFEEE